MWTTWSARLLGGGGLAAWTGWSGLAVLLAGGTGLLRGGLLLAIGVGLVALVWKGGWRAGVVGAAVFCLAATGFFFVGVQPRHDRQWTGDQDRMPRIVFDGDRVTIHDHRAFRYRAVDDWDAHWTTETFDLSELVGADLGIEQFASLEAVAHTFVSFRFADGRVLVASVEIRKEQGESFSPLLGLFRNYELMIVLGDERDLVELRAVHREDTVYLHPLDLPKERLAQFLRVVLEDAARLHEQPAFYNTLTASCSSTLAQHLRSIEPVGLDLRMAMPGYVDALAYEWDWLAGEGTLEALRERNRIDDRARAAAGSDDFSARIRAR
jgi:hypothetical protein